MRLDFPGYRYIGLYNETYLSSSDTAYFSVPFGPLKQVATPTFTPPGGTFSSAQSVSISCTTSGATIRYTTNGVDPTSSSAVYSGPISVISGSVTIKARAFKSDMD